MMRARAQERCQELGLENAFPKPFCSLKTAADKPIISRFVTELKVGRPSLEISTARRDKYEVIDSTIVERSAPCGSTWYVAKKIIGGRNKKGNPLRCSGKSPPQLPVHRDNERGPRNERAYTSHWRLHNTRRS